MSVERLEFAEIQGLIVSGYAERPCAKYVLFAIDDVARARAWLTRLVDRLQYGEFIATPKGEPPYLNDVCLNLALTYAGFERLGLAADTLLGFSGSFRGGMAAPHRSRQLGDDGPSAPTRWHWGGNNDVHGILLVYAGRDDGDPEEDERCAEEITREVAFEHGLRALATRHTTPIKQKNRAEHFGFADGISNPTLAGLDLSGHKRDVIPNGEVVLGYLNGYGKHGLSPLVDASRPFAELLPGSKQVSARRDFGRNGSYLVFRELAQDVAGFWQFMEQAAARLPSQPSPLWLASRMVGRWPNGVPVTMRPELDDPHEESSENRFGYHDHADYFGTACPIGSHIRRTNPRETMLPVPHDPPLAEDICDRALAEQRARNANRHRLLRRGRIYGPRRAERLDVELFKQPDGHDRGLHFLCFVANIRRQFEFVQGTWIVNPNFAGLSRDPDPLLAAQRSYPFEANSFVVPGCPVRFVDGLPRFVETRGGAYFFMPSRSALRYVAALGRSALLGASSEPSDGCERALAELERRKVELDFAQQPAPKRPRRAFHGKSHGIVQATLTVDPDLPASFQAGVFTAGARYRAWVRFSSGNSGLHPDTRRDVHGIAIKLLGVPNAPRASDYEAATQDFLLIDTPRLMVASPDEVLALERANVDGKGALARYVLRHPHVLIRLLGITSSPRHPLERTYHSITPFAYGEGRVVRWVVRLRRGESLVEVPEGTAHLREALRVQLARGPVALELCIQNRGTRALPLDDARAAWPIGDERVATLTLLPDGFDSAAQEELGDGLSFNPWNALLDHRPLGAMNRVRRLYRDLYELRMRLAGKLPFEPRAD